MTTTKPGIDSALGDTRRVTQFHAARASALSRVLPGVAHQVRGPLNGLSLNAELVAMSLSGEETDPERARKYLEGVRNDLERFQKAFSRFVGLVVPSGRGGVGELDLREVVGEVESLVAVQARHEKVALRVERPDDPVPVRGQRLLLEQAILGLAVNALDALAEAEGDKELAVVLEVAGDRARLTVSDSGVGVAVEDLPRVFEPHFTRKEEAGGVGLPVSRFLLEAHGGSITLASERGRGTEVAVALPLCTGGNVS